MLVNLLNCSSKLFQPIATVSQLDIFGFSKLLDYFTIFKDITVLLN
jgi:hypothetical protein